MNKIINLEDFPKNKRGNIIWKEVKDLEYIAEYNGVIYNIYIIGNYYNNGKNTYLDILYNKEKYTINTDSLKNVSLRDIVNEKVKDYILKTKYIIDYERCYKELNLEKEYIDNLPSKTDKKLYFICKECGISQNKLMTPRELYNEKQQHHRNCEFCGEHYPFPEKFVKELFKDINQEYVYQLSKKRLKWCKSSFYDFYFNLDGKEYIVETHGKQHYEEVSNFNLTLEQQQLNDDYKRRIALANGIEPENYIVLDCRKSELEWIKNSIINSKLADIFDLTNIDWKQINLKAEKNKVKTIIEKWSKINKTSEEVDNLAKELGIARSVLLRTLRTLGKNGVIDYNIDFLKEEKRLKLKKSNGKFKYIFDYNNKHYEVTSLKDIANILESNTHLAKNIVDLNGKPYISKDKRYKKYNGLIIEKITLND